jgi:hypothetical protein
VKGKTLKRNNRAKCPERDRTMKTTKNSKTATKKTTARSKATKENMRLGGLLKSAKSEPAELVSALVDGLADADRTADRANVTRIYRFAFEVAARGEHLRFISRRWRKVLTAGFLAGLEARATTTAAHA